MKKVFRYSLILLLSIYILACGNRKAPTGGKKDNKKPEIISIDTEEFSQINSNYPCKFTFSKSMDRNSLYNGLRIYPLINKKSYKWNDKTLEVFIDEKLESNTNYFFIFSKQIRDAHNNYLKEKEILTYHSGKLNSLRISGNFSFENIEDKDIPVTLMLFSADTTFIFKKRFKTTSYEIDNLNEKDHIIRAFSDLNKNQKYDKEKEPYFEKTIKYSDKNTISFPIELVYRDSTPPKIKSAKAIHSKLINIRYSENIKNFGNIEVFNDSLNKTISVRHTSLSDNLLELYVDKMDTLNYKLKVYNALDIKNNLNQVDSTNVKGITYRDTIPPEILRISPPNGSVVKTPKPTFEIEFNEILLDENLHYKLFNTENNKEIKTKIRSKIKNMKKFKIKPVKKLENYTSYKFVVTDKTTDLNNNNLKKNNNIQIISIFKK